MSALPPALVRGSWLLLGGMRLRQSLRLWLRRRLKLLRLKLRWGSA